METNSLVKSFMIEKILKIDFQNFYIYEMPQNVYLEHFSVVYTTKLSSNTHFMK